MLTDNTFLLHGESGEWKAFFAPDGFGLRLLMDAGVKTALTTGRNSPIVERRAKELGMGMVLQGRRDKAAAFTEVCEHFDIAPENAGYVGDDLVDLGAMRLAGFSAAPADARAEVREVVDVVTAARGGRGAVREICELLLHRMGKWDEIVRSHRGSS